MSVEIKKCDSCGRDWDIFHYCYEQRSEGLSPCPFCGDEAGFRWMAEDYCAIQCKECQATGPYVLDDQSKVNEELEAMTAKLWNELKRVKR